MQFFEPEDEEDWRNYTEYLTIATVRDGLEKLRALKDEYRVKIM